MARYNPLVFPDPNFVTEFTPPPAEDGTVIGKTWYWTPPTGHQDSGHWELRQTEVKEMAFAATRPMTVRRKTSVGTMSLTDDIYTDTIVYGFSMNDLDKISYSYTYKVAWAANPIMDPNYVPKDEDEHFVINGYHNPKIVLIRGNKYTFDYSYSKATSPYEFYIHEGFFRQGKAAFRLFEDGVVRDETNNTVTFTVPGDAPPRLIYGPQPDGFQSHRTGEIAIEDKVTL